MDKKAETAPELTIVPTDTSAQRLQELHTLFQNVWPKASHLDVNYLGWLYRDNPQGAVVGFDAFSGKDLVGHYATIPTAWKIDGKEQAGVLSLNTAVRSDFRGRGLFKILAQQTYQHAVTLGKQFVVGVSNAQSTLLFRRQFKFQLLGPMDVKIGIGRRPKVTETKTEAVWSESDLTWRLKRPHSKYLMTKSGDILAKLPQPGMYAVMGKYPKAGSFGKSPLLPPIAVWIGFNTSLQWNRQAYVSLPMRLRPSPLNVIYKNLVSPEKQIDANSVNMSLFDFDAY